MSLLLDSREGSWQLALVEPVRSLLPLCPTCGGVPNPPSPCPDCRQLDKKTGQYVAVGRQLSRLTTSRGEGGPDVLIAGNGPNGPLLVAVEVKSLRDLLASADSGRLQAHGEGQLQAMLTDYAQSWLLWYGVVRASDDGYLEEPIGRYENGHTRWRPFTKNRTPDGRPIRADYLEQMLLAIAAMGVHIHHEATDKHAARWLGALYRYWTKPWDDHEFERRFSAAPRFPKAIKGYTPQQLARAKRVFDRYTGMGMETALAAAKHFPTVRAMAEADEKEWRKVPGVGKVKAAALVEEFNS